MTDAVSLESCAAEICTAARRAFSELFATGESFYYCVLITTEEGHAPFVSAWSHEALDREKAASPEGPEYIEWVKWSYADSPYVDFSAASFDDVRAAFASRPDLASLSAPERSHELALRMRSMESAMMTLDAEGLFSLQQLLDDVLINVEMIPPSVANTARAVRLNSRDNRALSSWLAEAAEKP